MQLFEPIANFKVSERAMLAHSGLLEMIRDKFKSFQDHNPKVYSVSDSKANYKVYTMKQIPHTCLHAVYKSLKEYTDYLHSLVTPSLSHVTSLTLVVGLLFNYWSLRRHRKLIYRAQVTIAMGFAPYVALCTKVFINYRLSQGQSL